MSGWTALLQYWGSRKPSLVQSKVGCSPSLMVSVVSVLTISVAISCVCCAEREKCGAEERVLCWWIGFGATVVLGLAAVVLRRLALRRFHRCFPGAPVSAAYADGSAVVSLGC